MYDYVRHCVRQPKRKNSQIEEVEDFESRLHKAASFLVEGEKEMQE